MVAQAASSPSNSSTYPEKLLERIRHGELDRLGRLLQLYRNYLNLLADSQLDRKLRRRISPSDIVQETMLKAHRDFPQFRGTTEYEFLAWLRRILVNSMARAIEVHVLAEKRDVRREVSLEAMRASMDKSSIRMSQAIADREDGPNLNAERHERAVFLADLMSQLSDAHREILMLRNLQGLRFPEIAAKMDRSVPAVKMLWMRAIKQLRALYDATSAR